MTDNGDKAALLALLLLKAKHQANIQTFLASAYALVYAAAVRLEYQRLTQGLATTTLKLTNPKIIAQIDTAAATDAKRVVETFNRMLTTQVDGLPADLTSAQMQEALTPFYDSADTYNRDVLAPFLIRTWAGKGSLAASTQNGLETLWRCEPEMTAGLNDGCDDAVDMGDVPAMDASAISMPAHLHCPHEWVPVDVPANVPLNLWGGE